MAPSLLYDVVYESLLLLLLLSAPILAAAFFSSLLVGLLANYTKLSEPALGYAARSLAVLGGLILISPWLGGRVMSFASKTWLLLQTVVS